MTKYIDIHTHSDNFTDTETISVLNVSLPGEEVPLKNIFSAGFHPWNSGNNSIKEIEGKFEEIEVYKNFALVGECGIDRSIEVPIEKQISEFKTQIEIAGRLGKPLIIHCVRAYSDLLQIYKSGIIKTPLIIHNYQGNITQTKQLLKFNCHFSFGESLLSGKSKVTDTFLKTPLNSIFLETDESCVSIREMYTYASKLLKMDENKLKIEISNNLKALGISTDN